MRRGAPTAGVRKYNPTVRRSGHYEVWSLDHATGALHELTRGDRHAVTILAQRSPDGRSLAVLRGRQGGWSAWGTLDFFDMSGMAP